MSTPSASPPPESSIRLRSPADLLAFTPYLLGYHPSESLVAIAFRGQRAVFAARADLPTLPAGTQTGAAAPGSTQSDGVQPEDAGPGQPIAEPVVQPVGAPAADAGLLEAVAEDLLTLVQRQGSDTVALIGYGPRHRASPALHALEQAAQCRRLEIYDTLRVEHGRWWSEACADPSCCPPEGTPFDPSSTVVAAQCTVAGLTADPDREALARRVAPPEGAALTAITRATDHAEVELWRWLETVPESERPAAVARAGTAAVEHAIAAYAAGDQLADDALAWLSLLLVSLPVRDAAWLAITDTEPHLQLWTDATRRVVPELVPAPASLLAFTAWRAGDGALARLALERALAEDDGYSMAQLLLDGLTRGVPPWQFDGWGADATAGPEHPESTDVPEGTEGPAGTEGGALR